MRITNGPIWFDVAADLVDEALLVASRSAAPAVRQQYLADKEAIASIEIVDIREERFRQLDSQWAERFRLVEPLSGALEQLDGLSRGVSGCVLDRVRAAGEEGAALEPSTEGNGAVLYLRLKAESLLSGERLLELAREGLSTNDRRK